MDPPFGRYELIANKSPTTPRRTTTALIVVCGGRFCVAVIITPARTLIIGARAFSSTQRGLYD